LVLVVVIKREGLTSGDGKVLMPLASGREVAMGGRGEASG